MDFSKPISVKLGEFASVWTRTMLFFGHYDARIYVTPTAFLEVGAGSWHMARRVVAMEGFRGCLGRVGRHCEIAEAWILHGGSHRNDLPVNVGFAQAPLYQAILNQEKERGVADALPIDIGDNVVISWGATVLNGVSLGTGSVIGAGAVVTRNVEPFTIVGGVPAKLLKQRFPDAVRDRIQAVRWWDFAPDYMGEHIARIQDMAQDPGPHRYRTERPRFVVRLTNEVEILGFVDGDGEKPLNQAPISVQQYAAQAAGPGPHHWMADCWSS